MNAKNVVNHTS